VVPPATETGSCLAAERDCTGVCFGAAQVDACGVCNGDGRACRAPAAPVAPTCAGPAPSLTVFTDIAAFSGQPHAVVTFDPADERDAASVQAKFGNLSAFRISGGAAAVRPTQSHAANFAGEGTEGGPTSGTYRVDWGYYGRSDVTATFVNPVAAAGAMFGGGAGSQGIIVTLDDGCRARIALPDYLPLVPNGANGCMAINGFLGVASTDGRKIQEIAFTSSHDASSLDDVVFGDAMTQGLGVGPTSFPESGFTATACNTGAAGGDGQAPTGPVPSAPSLPAAGACPADRPADCTGACGGTAAVDDCGVCNGDNACWGATPGSGDGVGVGGGGAAARCSGIPVQYHLLTDEAAFQGAPHSVLTFEPANQRTPAGILSAHPSLSGFSISGGAGAVRFRASHAADFGGEGTEGGPSSGDYRIDWGYYGLTSVDLAFATGVQAVGAIYGGSVGGASLLVTLDDGCEVRARILDTALASVPNGADQCSALNGFMGIALDPAETRTIVSARLSASRDASSVDDITFGAVSQVNLPPGPSPRAESPYQSQCIPAAPRCDDGIRNGGEAGVDCGGPCTACPSCSDGVRNGGEVDVDCGGPCAACLTCTDGLRGPGEDGVDCGGVCDLPCPTCSDGAQNQGEAGVDCGGPCVACPTCSDGLQNQGEAGVDCGGPCAACPSCNDGLRNQGELGVDCGGPCSAGCESCTDGIQNQGEQGVDCGTVCNNTCNCAGQTNLQPTCQALKAAVPAAQSAFYCLDPDGNAGRAPIQTYCDMATDGGGWTAITNVIASGAPRVSGGSLSTNYMLPAADIQALASWASEVRFECKRAGVATYLDVKTSNPSWTTRPWGAGDGCTQAYNWRPSLSSWSALPKNTVPIVTNPTTVSCCCRPGHSLLTYQIGMSTQNWLINDLYYNSWSRYCGGGVGEYHRIYYR
jgi:hypothetical protein